MAKPPAKKSGGATPAPAASDKGGDPATADAVAAGAIEGARAAEEAGGDAGDVTAAAIGGAAAAATAETGENVVADGAEAQPEQAAEPAPAAPGEDADAVFQRRLERLDRLIDDAEFESGTAFGDLRDTILDLFKHRPKVWSAMSAGEQQDTIRAIEAAAKRILSKVVLVMAEEDSLTVQGTMLGQFSVKGEAIEAKLKIEHADADVLQDVFAMAGHKIVLISADDKRFMSARGKPEVMADQTAMEFGGDAKAPREITSTPPKGPADDSDLNPDDDDDGDDEVQERDPNAQWGVFDTTRSEWLIDEKGGDDGWTSNRDDAGRFTFDRAKELSVDFAADNPEEVVARQLDVEPDERTHDQQSAVDD